MAWKTIQHSVTSAEAAPLATGPEGEMGITDQSHKLTIGVGEDFDTSNAQVFHNGARVPNGTVQWQWNRPASTNDIELWWPVDEDDVVIIEYDSI